MKAILEYDLPEDQSNFNLAVKSWELWHVLWELDNFLRSNTKYAPDDMSSDEFKAYEKVREEFYRIMNDNGVSLSMVE